MSQSPQEMIKLPQLPECPEPAPESTQEAVPPQPETPQVPAQTQASETATTEAREPAPRRKNPARFSRVAILLGLLAHKLRGKDFEEALVPADVTLLEDADVYIRYRVEVYTRDKQEIVIHGASTLPEILSERLLPEAHSNFEAFIGVALLRPLLTKFHNMVQRCVVPDESNQSIRAGSQIRPALPSPSGTAQTDSRSLSSRR